MAKIVPTGYEETLGTGKILELVSYEVDINGRKKMFEKARRGPGVRVILFDESNQKILLAREYRVEQGKYDYRLPGGKVFDTLPLWKNSSLDIGEKAKDAVIREAREETGIIISEPELLHISPCGASIEWDLYYFLATRFEDIGAHERDDEGESDMTTDWYTLDAVREKILTDEMSEDRSIAVLLKWMMTPC